MGLFADQLSDAYLNPSTIFTEPYCHILSDLHWEYVCVCVSVCARMHVYSCVHVCLNVPVPQ